MKKILMIILMSAMVIGAAGEIAFAGNSEAIMVSCSIPAVPGLNVPLLQERTTRIEPNMAAIKEANLKPQEKTAAEPPKMIQESKEKKIELADKGATSVSVETIYVR